MYNIFGPGRYRGAEAGNRIRPVAIIRLCTCRVSRYQRDDLFPWTETMSRYSEASVTPANQLEDMQAKPAEQEE